MRILFGKQAKMSNILLKLQPWIDARRRFKLSHAQIQMARELGMNPKKFGSLANEKQEPWKVPLQEFIVDCYFKRFKRSEPAEVRSIEDMIEADAMRRKLKQARKASEATVESKDGGIEDALDTAHRI
ncbi:MAG: hypothetical protein Q8K23_00575 [Sulfuritalea sp.]|nr:hypothetical protein [Sulfuritalea sp.]